MKEKIAHNKPFLIFLVLIGIFSAVFLTLSFYYADKQLKNAYINWQNRISIISEVKLDNINRWLKEKEQSVESIAENLTVQMYLSEHSYDSKITNDKIIQQEFLTSYLISESRKSGFYNSNPLDNSIKANVEKQSNAALVVFDKDFNIVVSKDYESNLQKIFSNNLDNESRKIEIESKIISEGGTNYYYNIQPVNFIQSDDLAGYVFAIKEIDESLKDILSFPPESFESSNSIFAVKDNNNLKIISSSSNHANLAESISLNSDKVMGAEAFSVQNPDQISIQLDGKRDVLIIAKQIQDNPWFFIYKIAKKEALKEALSARKLTTISAILLLCTILLFVILAWRHSSSIKYKKLSTDFEKKNRLLSLITENQIQRMFIIDTENVVRFVNDKFAETFNIESKNLKGKPLENVLGPEKAKEYTSVTKNTSKTKKPLVISRKIEQGEDKESYIQSKFIPITKIPLKANKYADGTLIVENDITEIISARLRTENNLNQMVNVMVGVVEERSVYYHQHSKKVSELGVSIAADLKLSEREVRAISVASRLNHLHMALLPSEILNKKGRLTTAEKKMVNNSTDSTVELIKGIDFDSPVVETISQASESCDGKGKLKLKENDILITAKVLRAANDYVAMTSPRAYRKELSKEKAIEEMLKFRGKIYSSDVVYSLINIVNKSG